MSTTGGTTGAHGQLVMGRYRIVRRLAKGGMGVVYLARVEGAEGFVRPAVIKRMLPDLVADDEMVRLFVREARILSGMRHPGIVSVLDFAVEQDAYLMALEYVHGYHVGRWLKYLHLRGRAFDPQLAAYVVAQVLDALDYAHQRTDERGRPLGIVHRDISPSNIVLDVEGRVRLLDFGVARVATEDPTESNRVGDVSVKGKFAYMAPELLQGLRPSVASDVYACGVVLHELLRGGNEFRHRDPAQTLQRVLIHELSPIEAWRDDVPEGATELIRRATHRDPARRYPSAAAMAAALRELLDAPERAVEARLREAVRADFCGGLPERLGLPTLDELEQSWREVGEEGDGLGPEPVTEVPSQPPTVPAKPVPGESPPERPAAGARWTTGLLGVVAAAALAVGLYSIWAQEDGPPSPVIVVDRPEANEPPRARAPTEEPPADASAPDAPPRDVGPEVGPGDAGAAAPADARAREPRRPHDTASRLTWRFHRRRRAVERCFTAHAASASGQPQLSVRFHVDAEGRVERAELVPAAVGETPLGQCLLEVARETDFGPQRGPLRFRIPIRVRGP
jgi:serine/threonine-protein kinase